MEKKKLKIGLYKFSSCAGCQVELLHYDEHLLDVLDLVELAYVHEFRSFNDEGPYDVGLAEGAVTCEEEVEKIKLLREKSKILVAFGACATYGGLPGLKNWKDINKLIDLKYVKPENVGTLPTGYPADKYVKVDAYLQGCPVDKNELVELIQAVYLGKTPNLRPHTVCMECKANDNVCILINEKQPCMGSVTRAGCGALCPTFSRACYSCHGPMSDTNVPSLVELFKKNEMSDDDVTRRFRSFTPNAEAYAEIANHKLNGWDKN